MGLRGKKARRSLSAEALVPCLWIAASLSVVLSVGAARAQDDDVDTKPEMDLPPITLEGLDETILGPGEAIGSAPAGQEPLPLDLPAPELPAPISLGSEDNAADFEPIGRPDGLTPLRIQGFARGGSFQTITAGFDATHELTTGAASGRLAATASDGHLDDGAWSQVEARVGTSFEPVTGAAFRTEVAHTSREHELPRAGFLTDDLAVPGSVQTFHDWSADVRYRFEQEGFTAGVALEGERGVLREETSRGRQAIEDGTASIHFDLPLYEKLWNIETNLALGALREERRSGSHAARRRVVAELLGRYEHPGGWGVEGGVAYRALGDVDVFGPIVRVSHTIPSAYRVWVAMEPHFTEPKLLDFLAETPYAAGVVEQDPERATVSLSGGGEMTLRTGLEGEVSASLRRSNGYLHADVDEPGRYALVNLDRRLVFELDGVLTWLLPEAFVATAAYRMHQVEGAKIPYVLRHSGELAVKRQAASFEFGASVRYLGSRWGGDDEGKLAAAWITSAEAAVPIAGLWRLSIGAHNLFDREYRELAEYRARGRWIEGGIRYSF